MTKGTKWTLHAPVPRLPYPTQLTFVGGSNSA
jgi:hypothetical protein